MPVSQNGFSANNRALINTKIVPGTNVSLPVRRGPAGDLLIWAAARWHREVEPLVNPGCWGYAERQIRGGTQLSNHASGTAIDLNAPAHPLGVTKSRTFSPAKIAAAHRIIADTRPALRWGGDYDDPAFGGVRGSRPDPMHVEINASEAVCAQVLARVNGSGPQEDDVQLPTLQLGDGIPDKKDTGANDPGRKHWFVTSAQALINLRGLPAKVVVDGQFGSSTEAMVKALQKRSRLPETGRIDGATWYWLLGNDAPDWI